MEDYTKSLRLYRRNEVLITNHPWHLLNRADYVGHLLLAEQMRGHPSVYRRDAEDAKSVIIYFC